MHGHNGYFVKSLSPNNYKIRAF